MAMKMTTEIQATIFLLSICPFLVFGDGVTSGVVKSNYSDHTSDTAAVNADVPSDLFHLSRDDVSRLKRREVNDEVKKIICYHCQHDPDGNKNADCLDPFWEHDIPVVSCKGTCVKSKRKVREGVYKVSRACWKLKCTESSTGNLTRTCCNTNHCNSADTQRWSRPGIVAMMTLVTLVTHFVLST